MIVCKRCGFKNQDDDADFCASCGRFLEWTGERVEQPVEAEPVQEEEAEEAGRRGFVQRVEGWVREQRSGGEPGSGGEGTVLVAEASASSPDVAVPAGAPGNGGATALLVGPEAPSADDGSTTTTASGDGAGAGAEALATSPAETAVAGAGEAAPVVFGPVLPLSDEGGPATTGAAGVGGTDMLASAASAEEARAPDAEPAVAVTRDPILAGLIASPVAIVPDLEPEPPKPRPTQATDSEAGGGVGTGRREAAPERQPGEVVHKQVFRPARYAPEAKAPSIIVRPGDTVCPRCKQGNYAWRNYCRRCGLLLDHGSTGPERHGPWQWFRNVLVAPVQLRRHLVRAGDRPGRKYRDSPKARRTTRRFTVPKFNKKKFAKAMPILIIVVLLVGFFGPWKKSFDKGFDHIKSDVENKVNIQYVQEYPTAIAASSSAPHHAPLDANDNDTTTFWASAPAPSTKTKTTGKGKGKTSGKGSTTAPASKSKAKPVKWPDGVGQSLTVDFSQSESISGFGIFSGAQTTSQNFQQYAHPDKIELFFSGTSSPESITLANTSKFQEFKFLPRSTTFVKLVIESIFPGQGTAVQKQECAITDVLFYTRT